MFKYERWGIYVGVGYIWSIIYNNLSDRIILMIGIYKEEREEDMVKKWVVVRIENFFFWWRVVVVDKYY